MIKNSQKQAGSAHLIIIIILFVVLIGALGFIFWQNFIKKDDTVKSTQVATSSNEATPKPVTYKTYTTDVYGMSFQYPDTWTLGDTVKSDEENNVSRATKVTTAQGDEVNFAVGIRGLGGTCDAPSTFKVIDTSSTTIPGDKSVNFSFTLKPNVDGAYEGYYGLTDYYTTVGDVQTCPNTFYYVFSPTNNSYGLIQFNAIKDFSSIDAAKSYIATDEYKAVKKMITSLTY